MSAIERRKFLGLGLTSLAAVMALGSTQAGRMLGGRANAATQEIELTISDAIVEMVDLAPVYMWTFADAAGPSVPGPVLYATEGDTIELSITNALDEPHAFAVAGTGIMAGPIAPGAKIQVSFEAPAPGTYIYLDPLSAPLNRIMGLHGVLVVLPAEGPSPYASPPPALNALFSDLGTTDHFPGEPWSVERTRIWHIHTVDPRWNARVDAGQLVNPAQMAADFLPQYFLLNGQSGFFASHHPDTTPVGRIGQPHLIRIVNTGLASHSLHIHGNHVFVTAENGVLSDNIPFVDSWQCGPLDRVDWLLPYLRPPDIPGPVNRPLNVAMREELNYRDKNGLYQSPIEYPMHCHMEPSQTAAGGNYPGGLVTHWAITGDLDGTDFPNQLDH
jgi:FtsP/CotA-like multicopper oxidase with cupredoxin domain